MNSKVTFYIVFALISASNTRRYDIEEEANKLYGASLKSVLDRFRRTPEYLKILNDQIKDLFQNIEVTQDRLAYAYKLKLFKKVVNEMGGNESTAKLLRMGNQPTIRKHMRKPVKMPRHGGRKAAVNVLDRYPNFRSPLTLEEKNRMRDLGYEYIGRAIHAMIEHLTPDGVLSMSTLLPYGGDQEDKTLDQHIHHHEITKETTATDSTTDLTYQTFHHHTNTPESQRNFRLPHFN